MVSASNEGASIELASINLQDFDTIEDSNYELEFDIDNIGSTGTSFANISVDMQSMSGNTLSYHSESLQLDSGQSITFSHNLTGIPFGYVIIVVALTGDVTAVESTHNSTFQRTLHRLVPLNISIGQS